MADFEVYNTGSFSILVPLNATSETFVEDNLVHAETVRLSYGIAIEPRYLDDIVTMLDDKGFVVAAI